MVKSIWMIATSPSGKGGIASVIEQYQTAGVFDDGIVHFEPSHHGRNALGRILPFLKCAAKLWTAMLFGRVQLIHIHTSYGLSFWRKLLLVLPALMTGIPVLTHLHAGSFNEWYAKGSLWRKYWLRFLLKKSYRVIALSEEWKTWVLGVEPCARVLVLPNSLVRDTGLNRSTAKSSNPTVLYLGKIGDQKGSFDLLKAFVAVKSAVPDARLVVGGNGEVDRFLAEAKKLKISDAVEFVGWADEATKTRLMHESWVFVLPSYKEGLPMAILEAMAFSKAIVSCPVGGIPQALTNGETGLLVAPGDIGALSDSLISCLTDSGLNARLGVAARATFDAKFSHDANLPELFSIYKDSGVLRVPVFRKKSKHVPDF
jgi:glycosyltransferase involved in cell wall biosynthesis